MLIATIALLASTLNIYFIDVEGGAATLIVTPAGESLLIDTGWPGGRDAKRIQAAMQDGGVTRIDHLLISHYHRDHWGGVADLAKLVPIANFYDHGRVSSLEDDKNFSALNDAYSKASGDKSHALKPGDSIPLKGAQVRVLASGGAVGGVTGYPNRLCADAKLRDPDASDNARAVGILLTFGKFHFLDLADLTWNIEQNVVCPVNQAGAVDLYQVDHHGMDISNNPVLLQSIRPRVAVMDNGPAKGGSAETYARLKAVPGLEAIYQLHRNLATKDSDNTSPELTANLGKEADCPGNAIKVSVAAGGDSFTVTNTRTGKSQTFTSRP